MTAPAPVEQRRKADELRHVFCVGCVGFDPGIKVALCGSTANCLGIPVSIDPAVHVPECVVCRDIQVANFAAGRCAKCQALR